MILSRSRTLVDEGVLGLNKRNGDYILRFNPRRLYPLVDDKLKTKRLALAAGIAVPQLYGVIETQLSLPGSEPGDGFYAAVITSG